MKKYDHLFFDLDNTLWDFTTNSRLAMSQTLEQTKLLAQLPTFDSFFQEYEQINKLLWTDYHSGKIDKSKLIVERFAQSFSKFGISNLDWTDLNRQYLDNMALQTSLFDGTLETLSTLKLKGYQMHIITNGFREVQRAKLINCGIANFFTKVFISEEIKVNKPHRQIFEHALRSTNALKKKSIMIGDSWEADIEGALNFGIDQIMFLNNGWHEIPEQIKIMRLTINPNNLQIKPSTNTWFVNKIADLLTIV